MHYNCTTYLTKRGQTFYFQYRIPSRFDVDILHIKRSLRTTSYYEALHLVKAKLPIIELLQMSTDPSQVKALLEKLADFREVDRLREHKRRGYAEGVEGVEDEVRQNLEDGNQIPYEFEGITFENDPENLRLVLSALERLHTRVLHGDQQGSQIGSNVAISAPQEPVVPLSKAIEMYLEAKQGGWTPRYAKETLRMLPMILLAVGDMAIKAIRRKNLREALELLAGLPRGNVAPYNTMSLAERFECIGETEDVLAGKTVGEYKKVMQSLFSTFLVSEKDLLDSSPTDGLKFEIKRVRYGVLTLAQTQKLLASAKSHKHKWFYHFLMISFYSGMRRSEIAGLDSSKIQPDDSTGRKYFLIEYGKTESARRKVPIHKELLPLLDTIEWHKFSATRASVLFKQLQGELLLDEDGNRIVLHSARHTFITTARSYGANLSPLQSVVGHTITGGGVTDRYTHKIAFNLCCEVVDIVSYGS